VPELSSEIKGGRTGSVLLTKSVDFVYAYLTLQAWLLYNYGIVLLAISDDDRL